MKKIILLSTLGALLVACSGQSGQQNGGAPQPEYRTTAPSLLYFKNMRSAYYEMSEQPNTRIELYRLPPFSPPPPEPLFIPVIANNWLEDEAYLMLEPHRADSPVTVRWEGPADTGLYRWKPTTAARQHKLALQLYESLQAGHQLSTLATDSTWTPIFTGKNYRNHYMTTIRDYLRLTEAL